jgi:hypothetical protein
LECRDNLFFVFDLPIIFQSFRHITGVEKSEKKSYYIADDTGKNFKKNGNTNG